MPKSRSLKQEVMPMMKESTMQDMMTEGREMMISGKNSMMRGRVMMAGSKMFKKKQIKKDDTELSDLGGLNFDPKKMKSKQMPLTKTGKSVLSKMRETYGTKKGKSVFYASINANKAGSEKWHASKKLGFRSK